MPQLNNIEIQTPALTKEEHTALQLLHEGQADSYQQQLALKVIVNKFSRAHDMTYIPGPTGERASAFLSGRGFVGQKILKYLNLPIGKLEEEEPANV
jgi:hypothetical protein